MTNEERDEILLKKGLTKIQAGQTVENFLNDINDNFAKIQTTIEGAPTKITISEDAPVGGQHGDIWIVYEK